MYFPRLVSLSCILQLVLQTLGVAIGGKPHNIIRQETGKPLQSVVTWDEHSLYVRDERIVFYSGEFHPFRLPVTDLWLDVFQKVKALGYNGVSFYVDWALVEGTEGTIRSAGIFALEPFFDAASEAGIYLLARPGPYINAEASGGGFPGWLGRIKGALRTNATDFLSATDLYLNTIGQQISQAQITNGGPVILYQVENEYTYPYGNITFPNLDYFDYVINQAIDVGIVVPIINNDAGPLGYFAPGNASFGNVTVDIYGHDSYPLGFDCSHPYNWPTGDLPTNFRQLHNRESPETPYTIVEFQGGSFDPWGGPGFDQCNELVNAQFERVFYKNNWAAGVTMYNQYMIFGGTNWGNLGHPGGYTSYDYAAVIAEDRNVAREKYSEAKLQANFLKVSPSYLTSIPAPMYVNGTYADTDAIATNLLMDSMSDTNMYVIRHAAYNTNDSTSFRFTVATSMGNITIPQSSNYSSTLTLDGRDSKVMVTDYKMKNINLVYSSAEIFTWWSYNNATMLVLYGGAGETHELALSSSSSQYQINGTNVAAQILNGTTVIQWQVTEEQQSVYVEALNMTVYLLWRNDAYNWWDIELPAASPVSNYSSPSKERVVVKGPYLVHSADIQNADLRLFGEINATTSITVIGAPSNYDSIYFNDIRLTATSNSDPNVVSIQYEEPTLDLPNFSTLSWNSIDTLPELSSDYSDSAWPRANHTTTNNPLQPTSPYVLYASDYGFHTGPLLYRGHFVSPATNQSLSLALTTQGGYAYGYQVYLNRTLIHTYPGISTAQNDTASIALPPTLEPSAFYTITIIIDHTGLSENFNPGLDSMKSPRGIISYNLTSSSSSAPISTVWSLTGNLGGENYYDLSRGPLNEGGFYFERQGYHLPGAPIEAISQNNISGGPITGFTSPATGGGAFFFATNFALNLSSNSHNIPLQFTFTNTSTSSSSSSSSDSNSDSDSDSYTDNDTTPSPIRANLYVNGYQFGKYINNIGPQTSFPVPEGILNYAGDNYVGVYLWNLDGQGGRKVKLDGLVLESSSTPTYFGDKGRTPPRLSHGEKWTRRVGAY